MSTKNTKNNTQSIELSPEEKQKQRFLDFDPANLKGFDEVHCSIAEMIKGDLYDLLLKHAPAVVKLQGYDRSGALITGKRSRFQQAVLGLMKGPFSELIDSHTGKKSSSESLQLQRQRDEIAELKALLAALKSQ